MAAELDELFTAMGHQADVLPLAGPDHARRIGRRRIRNSVIAATAAVLLVVAGAGIATWRHNPSPEPILPANTIRGIAPIGSPLRLHGPGDENMFSTIAIDGSRVSVASGAFSGDSFEVIGVDTASGAKVWDAGRINAIETNGPVAVPGAMFLYDGPDLSIREPETGAELWKTVDPPNGDVVVGDGVLVRVNVGGLSEGFALRTGTKLWSVPAAGDDRPRHSIGFLEGSSRHSLHFSDDRFAQLTLGGTVLVRDIRTGKILTSVATTVRPKLMTSFTMSGDLALIGDTTGYLGKPSRLVAADVSTGKVRDIYSIKNGRMREATPCGAQRICVPSAEGYTADGGLNAEDVKVIDTTTDRVLWTARPGDILLSASSRAGRIFVTSVGASGTLYDKDGRVIARSGGSFHGAGQGWIDDENMLMLTSTATGYDIDAISAVDGTRTTLGKLSTVTGGCSWTSEILACRDGAELKLWRLLR
ncbi:PQQ-binding-like beta-propeller repeat protein [Actinoplanes sp. CA-015351]|uniref:outer membrane protein assembly factor BamB family protein n=1 Tax=Actinoplanes sp. CA-015351 TaxID=3239897 RepID=UPI003D99CB9F